MNNRIQNKLNNILGYKKQNKETAYQNLKVAIRRKNIGTRFEVSRID